MTRTTRPPRLRTVLLCTFWLALAGSARSSPDADFATVESANGSGGNAVTVVSGDAAVSALFAEMRALEPSSSGLPRFVVYFWKDREVARAFGVFESDLTTKPGLSAAVRALRSEPVAYMHRLTLPSDYVGRSARVVEALEGAGLRALFHRGAKSSQPYYEILLTERVDVPPDVAAAPDDPARAEFARALGGLFANRSDDPRVRTALSRLETTLYAYNEGLVSNPNIRSLDQSFRRYYRLGEETGPKVSLVARYTVSSRVELDEVVAFFADKGVRGPDQPGRFEIEVVSELAESAQLRSLLESALPDLISVTRYPIAP